MPLIRTRQDIDELLGGPTPAEMKLMSLCMTGTTCQVSKFIPNERNFSDETNVRAEVLRYLILGGCNTCTVASSGVFLVGAHISGELNLDYASTKGATRLHSCHIPKPISAIRAEFQELGLGHSVISGLVAWGSEVKGHVFLKGVRATGPIDLNGSRIRGQISAGSAQLNSETGFALNLHSSEIEGGVFLQHNSPSGHREEDSVFIANGGVKLTGAKIGLLYAEGTTLVANFDPPEKRKPDETQTYVALDANNVTISGDVKLNGGQFDGEVKFSGARIDGVLECEKAVFENAHGHAFNGQRMRVGQWFTWRKETSARGGVSLNGAHVAELYDEPKDWPKDKELFWMGSPMTA